MKQIKGIWEKLNGLKTTIAALYWGAVMPSLLVLYPAGVPAEINKPVIITGFFLTALGVGHKWYKKRSEVE